MTPEADLLTAMEKCGKTARCLASVFATQLREVGRDSPSHPAA